MLRHEDSLLDLVGAIHAAAADPDRSGWPRALGRLGDALSGSGVIVTDHVLPETIADLACAHVAPEVSDFIMGRLQGPANPLVSGLPFLPQRVVLAPDQLIGPDDYRRGDIYPLLQSVGLQHLLAAVLDRSDGRAIALSLGRPAARGPFKAQETALLGWVLPHLAGAVLVRRRLGDLLAAAEAPRSVLKLLDRGVILVDAASRMAYANPAAAKVLARRDGLAVDRGGALMGARPGDTGRLRRLIRLAAAAGSGNGLLAGGVVALPRPQGRPYVVQVLPLAPETDLESVPHFAFRPAVVLLVSDPDTRPVLAEHRLQQAYGLTRAEAVLTARLVEGLSLREAAEALGIGQNTAKSQLKAVFAKLEVTRQTALVRRILTDLGGSVVPRNGTGGNGFGRM
jgi:DNA-binding CsgD family transcriptional regulator